jgi:2-amino-4-hydroxy-6-hydroxymethyldihydropteridine diphosphokinase
LDIDIIDYDGLVQPGPPTLPHPRLGARAFVLVPLREIAPNWRHPESGASIDDMIAALGDEADIPIAV